MAEAPDDIIEGADPTVQVTSAVVSAYHHVCDCGYSVLTDEADPQEAMASHLRFGHPAYRNAAITCQASPMWDHGRWCIRPKAHQGDHWTPSINGGQSWPLSPFAAQAPDSDGSGANEGGPR